MVDPEEWWAATRKLHGNLHAIDVQFWFFNHMENVKRRLAAWQSDGVAK